MATFLSATLDIKTIAGAAPGWFRLRIGEYRICYYRARRDGPDGPVAIYAVERIVPRSAFDAAAVSLPDGPARPVDDLADESLS